METSFIATPPAATQIRELPKPPSKKVSTKPILELDPEGENPYELCTTRKSWEKICSVFPARFSDGICGPIEERTNGKDFNERVRVSFPADLARKVIEVAKGLSLRIDARELFE